MFRIGLICLLCWVQNHALDISITNFRSDISSQISDTLNLIPGFGDSLSIGPKTNQFRRVLTQLLNDGSVRNGLGGATPIVTSVANGKFKVAYTLWSSSQIRQNGAYNPPPADIAMRQISIFPESILVAAAQTLVSAENQSDTVTPKRFYGGLNIRPPPSFLNFFAADSKYVAYWGTLAIRGSIRRTTHLEAAGGGLPDSWGRYVPPSAPVICEGYGKMGAGIRPGSASLKSVLAYETTLGAGNYSFQVRFEEISPTSSQFITVNRTGYPEDFAVAVDSLGNALVLWREGASLFLAGFDSSRSTTQAPLLVQTSIVYKEAITEHNYRSYGATAIVNGRFVLVYVNSIGATVYRIVDLPVGVKPFFMGAELPVSVAGQTTYFPNVCSETGRLAFTWFHRVGIGNDRVMASLWKLTSNQPDSSTRFDLDAAEDSVGFGQVGAGWYPWHYLKTPSCALDKPGNLVVAYDNGFSAKAAIMRNATLYFDTAIFASRSNRIRNGVFTFISGLDSAKVIDFLITSNGKGASATLGFAEDSAFSLGMSGFQSFTAPFKIGKPFFRYRVRLQSQDTTRYTTPTVHSLILKMNVKPRQVKVDSIRIGSSAWRVYDSASVITATKRRDSIYVIFSGFDLDNEDSLLFLVKLGGKTLLQKYSTTKRSPGLIRCFVSLPPIDTAAVSLTYQLISQDSSSWSSSAKSFSVFLQNVLPIDSVQVIRHRGLDSVSQFWPMFGLSDTLGIRTRDSTWLHRGDAAKIRLRGIDGNDSLLTLRWFRNGIKLSEQISASGVFREVNIPLLSLGRPDTIRVEVSDADSTVTRTFYLQANRAPRLDSLHFIAYKTKDSIWVRQVRDRIVNFSLDSGLNIPLGLPTILRSFVSDSDAVSGDIPHFSLSVLSLPPGCTRGIVGCYNAVKTVSTDSILHAFVIPQDYLRLRVTDERGAFIQKTVRLEYPFLDTAFSSNRVAMQVLKSGLTFTLGNVPSESTLTLRISNLGTLPLRFDSLKTKVDQHRWFNATLNWKDSGSSQTTTLKLLPRTDRNPISSRGAWIVTNDEMAVSIRLFVDSLRRDSVIFDTLIIYSNDLSTPTLHVPIRLQLRALPDFTFSSNTMTPLNSHIPVRSTFIFTFSEAVRGPVNGSGLRIYSYRDSLANPMGFKDIPGKWSTRLNALSKVTASRLDSLPFADTIFFTPAYLQPALFSNLKPPDGTFMHRDIIRIRLSNSLVDRSGNALDIRGENVPRQPGSVDTILTVMTDTATLRVVTVSPDANSSQWNPDSAIRIRFNGSLRRKDSTMRQGVDIKRVGDSNSTVGIHSRLENGKNIGIRAIQLENGDSTLVIYGLRKPAARDTLQLWLSASIADKSGNFLDGDGDGFSEFGYTGMDSSDAYGFKIVAWDQGFYVFPNPFKYADARHMAKGSITFRNIHRLRGFISGSQTVLRIYSMTGDLVYSSKKNTVSINTQVSLDWNLRNDAGSQVATAVYLFSIFQGNNRLLKKGKVAVMR